MAGAAEVGLQVSGAGKFDSNVFRQSSNEVPSGGLWLSTRLSVDDDRERLGYRLVYQPRYDWFANRQVNDDVDHYLVGDASFLASRTTRLFARDRFVFTNSLFQQFDSDDVATPEDESAQITTARQQDLRNDFTLGIEQSMTSRLSGSLSFFHSYFKPEAETRGSSNSMNFTLDTDYRYDKWNAFGLGAAVTIQLFDEILANQVFVPASQAYSYNLFVTYRRKFTEDTALRWRIGPAFIQDSEQDVSDGTSDGPVYPAQFQDVSANDFLVAFHDTAVPASSCVGGNTVEDPDSGVEVETFNGALCPLNQVLDTQNGGSEEALARMIRSQNDAGQPLDFNLYTPPQPISNSQFTFFTDLMIEHRWNPFLNSSLSYRRSQGDSSGLGRTSVDDRVRFRTAWDVTDRLNLVLSLDWVQRNLATERNVTAFEVENDTPVTLPSGQVVVPAKLTGELVSGVSQAQQDQTRWRVRLFGNQRLSRRLFATGSFQYVRVESELGARIPFDQFLVDFGLRYVFDPIRVGH